MTNPFTALPPKVRAALYLIFAVASLVLGAVKIWFLNLAGADPAWLVPAGEVLLFIGAGLGLTAASNTDVRPGVQGQVVSREVVAEEYDPEADLPSDDPADYEDAVPGEEFPK